MDPKKYEEFEYKELLESSFAAGVMHGVEKVIKEDNFLSTREAYIKWTKSIKSWGN